MDVMSRSGSMCNVFDIFDEVGILTCTIFVLTGGWTLWHRMDECAGLRLRLYGSLCRRTIESTC